MGRSSVDVNYAKSTTFLIALYHGDWLPKWSATTFFIAPINYRADRIIFFHIRFILRVDGDWDLT